MTLVQWINLHYTQSGECHAYKKGVVDLVKLGIIPAESEIETVARQYDLKPDHLRGLYWKYRTAVKLGYVEEGGDA